MIRFTFTYYWWKKSAPVSLSIGEQGPLTFTFYWWNMAHTIIFTFTKIWSASLSLSMSEIWSRQLLLFSPEVKYDLQHCIVQGFHSPLSQLRCKSFLTVYRCTGTEFSLWRLCVYIPVLTVVIDDSLGRVGHESQNLQMLFSEQVMVRKDHINLVIFNLVSPPLWKEELSHNKLMHKVQMYMSCFCSVLLTHMYIFLCYAKRYSNWHQLLLLVSFGQIYFYQGFNGHNINSSWSPNKQRSNLVILFIMQKCRKDEDLLLLFKTEPGP